MSAPMTDERLAELSGRFPDHADEWTELLAEVKRLRKVEAAGWSAAETIEANRDSAWAIASADPDAAEAFEARVRAATYRWCLTRILVALKPGQT